MLDLHTFQPFPKISRLSRDMVVTEKLDGTNAQVIVLENGQVMAGKRTALITPQSDNFGFAAWVKAHEDELRQLGPGRHFGEWWGHGIQRGYGLNERRFSLFNVNRWEKDRPACCHVVPVLTRHTFNTSLVDHLLEMMRTYGSKAAPGFMKPEGLVVYHQHANTTFKKTLEDDSTGKEAATKGT